MTPTLTAAEYRAQRAAPAPKPKKRKKAAQGARKTPAGTDPHPPAEPRPSPPQNAESAASPAWPCGRPGCQVRQGAEGAASVVRVFNLTPELRGQLLDWLTQRDIFPTNP